jgi:hypothetical protein
MGGQNDEIKGSGSKIMEELLLKDGMTPFAKI